MPFPEAPTGVTATPGVTQATVNWTRSTSSDVTGYKVFCSPDNKLPNLASATSTSLIVQKLKNGIPYTFRVHAINAAGMSATSASAVPDPPPAAPKVAARRGSGSGTMIVDMIGKPQKGSTLTHYNLSFSPPAPAADIPTNVPAFATTFAGRAVISGLTLGTSYVVSATATGPTGTSPAGASKPVIAADVPDAPVIRGLSGIASVQISWDSPVNPNSKGLLITGYTLSYFTGTNAPTLVKAKVVNNIMVKALDKTKSYTFSVYATNAQGNSLVSNSLTITPN